MDKPLMGLAALIRQMAEAGSSLDEIADAVEAIEASQQPVSAGVGYRPTDEEIRQYDSPRKRSAYRYDLRQPIWADFGEGAVGPPTKRLGITQWWALARKIRERDGSVCTYCGASGEGVAFHCDHIIPVSLGGSNDEHNLTTACAFCNTSKNSRRLRDWSVPVWIDEVRR